MNRAVRIAATALALSTLALSAWASETASARAVIEQTVDQVVAILADPALDSETRRQRIEKIAYERFNFRTMSRLVLAKNWKRLTKQQQSDFVEEFTRYLANDYGNRLDRYEQEKVEIVGERPEPRGDVTIKTRIVGGSNDGALVDYRMRHRNGQWKIIDVVIEGISLVANFRDQFREVLGNGGADTLLAKLREKNARGSLAAAPQ